MPQSKVLQNRDLPLRSKRVVKVGETEILLIHCEAGIVAVLPKCPHAKSL
jgi:nitrite reductase/ring-hydroxylating ferredoxin subunit